MLRHVGVMGKSWLQQLTVLHWLALQRSSVCQSPKLDMQTMD